MELSGAEPSVAASRGRTVLVVEDDHDARDVLVAQLSQVGFRVHAVASGPAALDVLDGPEPIDLLCTDIVMPGGMSGYGVADAAVAKRPGIRVMFVSGYAGSTPAHGHLRHPKAPMLRKPFRRQELAQAVLAALTAN